MNTKQGFVSTIILFAILFGVTVVGGAAYYYASKQAQTPALSNVTKNTPDNSQSLSTSAGRLPDIEGVSSVKSTNQQSFSYGSDESWLIYKKDDKHVYVEGEVIPGADPATFVPLCEVSTEYEAHCAYGKDSKHVYAYTYVIPNADPATFVAIGAHSKTPHLTEAVDAHAYYRKYVPSGSTINSPLSGERITRLSDGSLIHFSNTSKMKINDSNEWGGYYEGVIIGPKSYFGGWYLVDGSSVYTVYNICDVNSSGKCPLKISRVNKVGEIPDEVTKVSTSSNPKLFIDYDNGFKLEHPSDINVDITIKKQQSYTANIHNGSVVVVFGPIKKAFKATESGWGGDSGMISASGNITVSVSSDKEDVSKCMTAPEAGELSPEGIKNIKISGVDFLSYSIGDPAMGLFSSTKTYTTLHGGKCYSVEARVSGGASGHMNVTDAKANDAMFDELFSKLDTIVQSFEFK